MDDKPDNCFKTYAPKEIPTSIERELFVVYDMSSGYVGIQQWNPEGNDFEREKIMLRPFTVTVDLPTGLDLTEKAVAQLREKEKDIQARFYKELTAVRDKIQNLLCIEHKPEQAQDAGDDARA